MSIQDRAKNFTDNLVGRFTKPSDQVINPFGTDDGRYPDLTDEQIETLSRRNGLAFRILNKYSQDPLEKWFELDTEDEEFKDAVEEAFEEHEIKGKSLSLLKSAMREGAATMAFGLRERNARNKGPSDPVNPEDVTGLEFVNVIRKKHIRGDRDTDGIRDGYNVDKNPESETFGELESIEVKVDAETRDEKKVINSDRFVHFKAFGDRNDPGGMSILEPLYNPLTAFENVQFGAGQAFYHFGTGFPEIETSGLDKKQIEELKGRLEQDFNEYPFMVHDEEQIDNVEFHGAAGNALNPENYMGPLFKTIAGSVGGSESVILGSSAGDLATAEVNQEQYFGDISSYQQNRLTPFFQDLIEMFFEYGILEYEGEELPRFNIDWNDLFEKSENTKADTYDKKSKAALRLTKMGLTVNEAFERVGLDRLEEDKEPSMSGGTEDDPATEGMTGDDSTDFRNEAAAEEICRGLKRHGFDMDEYFADAPAKVKEWPDELEEIAVQASQKLDDSFEQFVEDVVDIVDRARMDTDDEEQERNNILNEALFFRAFDRRLNEFEDEAAKETMDQLRDAFVYGAKERNEATSAVFNKHRNQIMDRVKDEWVRPAYANTSDAIAKDVDDAIINYFDTQDKGIDDLKRDIRDIYDGPSSQDYRFERIARTETARLRNTGYMNEARKRGDTLFQWVGPTDSKTTKICLSIKSGNPYNYGQLESATNGFLPHINCRHAPTVARRVGDDNLDREELVDELEKAFEDATFDADMEELDEVYSDYQEHTNMSASELENFADGECSKKASLDRAPIDRNLELLRTNKSDWTTKHIRWAKKTISFVSRMRAVEPGDPVDPESCGNASARDISLMNWAWRPDRVDLTANPQD